MTMTSDNSGYARLNGLERAYQYIYEHQIPLDQINAKDPVYQDFFCIDRDRYSTEEMTSTFQIMVDASLNSDYLPTSVLIPENRMLYIRKWPCFMPPRIYHHADALELHYVLQGQVTQTVNQETMTLQEGDLCLIAPEARYSLFISDAQVVMFSIIVYTDLIREILDRLNLEEDILSRFFSKLVYGQNYIPYLLCDIDADEHLRQIILDMIRAQDTEGAYTDRYLKTSFEMLCLRLLMNHKSRIIAGSSTLKKGTRITTIMEYAEAHYNTVTLEILAKRYNYSYSYLSSVIRKHYGHSFSEILTEIRLNKAVLFLKNTDYSVPAISELLGYSEKSYFYKLFKKRYHMTPEEYRHSLRTI